MLEIYVMVLFGGSSIQAASEQFIERVASLFFWCSPKKGSRKSRRCLHLFPGVSLKTEPFPKVGDCPWVKPEHGFHSSKSWRFSWWFPRHFPGRPPENGSTSSPNVAGTQSDGLPGGSNPSLGVGFSELDAWANRRRWPVFSGL